MLQGIVDSLSPDACQLLLGFGGQVSRLPRDPDLHLRLSAALVGAARSRERFGDTSFAKVDFQVRFGDPGREIAGFAETLHAELIVMPSHGRTGLSRFLIGSVAERVVRLAHCPVLILK